MFGFFKRNYRLFAPVSGKVIQLSEVPNDIFAEKMAGDGVAIDSTGDVVVAPADGTLSFIFKTNHAFAMHLFNGVDILVHVGLDTIGLSGKGFTRLVNEGEILKAGEPILRIDNKFIRDSGCSLISPVLITNTKNITFTNQNTGKMVQAGKNIVFEYKFHK